MELLRRLIPGNTFVSEATSGIFPVLALETSTLAVETDPAGLSPSIGDRWMIGTSAIGVWSGKDGQIAEWDGSDWFYWEDVSDIANWDTYGLRTGVDFLCVKDEIKAELVSLGLAQSLSTETDPSTLTPTTGDKHLIGTGAVGVWSGKDDQIATYNGSDWDYTEQEEEGFTAATSPEKLIATNYIRGTHAQRMATVGQANLILISAAYHQKAYEARQTRLVWAEMELYNELPDNHNDLRADLTGAVITEYLIMGVETLADHGREGVIDFLDGTAGTTWASDGLAQKAWTPQTHANIAALVTKLKDIIVKGIY